MHLSIICSTQHVWVNLGAELNTYGCPTGAQWEESSIHVVENPPQSMHSFIHLFIHSFIRSFIQRSLLTSPVSVLLEQ